jgi:hypothetical protein
MKKKTSNKEEHYMNIDMKEIGKGLGVFASKVAVSATVSITAGLISDKVLKEIRKRRNSDDLNNDVNVVAM